MVDDSAVSRAVLRPDRGGGGHVGGRQARDGREARRNRRPASRRGHARLQMPGMDGLAVLDAMLANDPVPVIMVSSLTYAGAAVTLDALDAARRLRAEARRGAAAIRGSPRN